MKHSIVSVAAILLWLAGLSARAQVPQLAAPQIQQQLSQTAQSAPPSFDPISGAPASGAAGALAGAANAGANGAATNMQAGENLAIPLARHWDAAAVRAFAELPIQEGGRIKPIESFARFELIRLSGHSTLKISEGRTLSAVEWLLECMFDSGNASQYPFFYVPNPQVALAVGLPAGEGSHSYSYAQIAPLASQLMAAAQAISQKKDNQIELTLVDNQILNFAGNVMTFEAIAHAADFAMYQASPPPGSPLAPFFKTPADASFIGVLTHASQIAAVVKAETSKTSATASAGAAGSAQASDPHSSVNAASPTATPSSGEAFLGDLQTAGFSNVLAVVPPSDLSEREWHSSGGMLGAAFGAAFGSDGAKPPSAGDLALLGSFGDALRQVDNPLNFSRALDAYRTKVMALAAQRGEARHVALEAVFYRIAPIYKALVLFGLGFLAAAFMWLRPRNTWLPRVVWGLTGTATLVLIASIVMRCIIHSRPPITNLYDTTLFVPAVAIIAALLGERMTRNRLGLSAAAAIGLAGMFIANAYEIKSGEDTMGSLVAVLDSNFWLSTHVTTVAMGYSAGWLAAALAHFYIFARALRLTDDRKYYKDVSRMVYGAVCFGTFFSFVGTVLGGIWANYSWGRFWGWDPKENGALLVILGNLVILHARMGGYVRDLGLCCAAIVNGMLAAGSWWGVNLLGVGLHSYGFTSGEFKALMGFWVFEAAVLLIGLAARQIEHMPASQGGAGPDKQAGGANVTNATVDVREPLSAPRKNNTGDVMGV